MLIAGCNNINPRRINTDMTKNIRELDNILFNAAKNTRKQMPQITEKYLLWIHSRLRTQAFHSTPKS
jgi:hypothetical protein